MEIAHLPAYFLRRVLNVWDHAADSICTGLSFRPDGRRTECSQLLQAKKDRQKFPVAQAVMGGVIHLKDIRLMHHRTIYFPPPISEIFLFPEG
jgi:hypothetical protein